MDIPTSDLFVAKNEDMSKKKKSLDLKAIESKEENVKEIIHFDYKYQDILCIPLILDLISQFIDFNDKKHLSFCNKKLYQLYCSQIRKIKINKIRHKIKILKLFNKYQNIIRLDLGKLYE